MLSSGHPETLVGCILLPEQQNFFSFVLLHYVLPTDSGPHGTETRRALFLSVTPFPYLGGFGDRSKGPGSQHVYVRCSAAKWERLEFQENTAPTFLSCSATTHFRTRDWPLLQPLGRRSQPAALVQRDCRCRHDLNGENF